MTTNHGLYTDTVWAVPVTFRDTAGNTINLSGYAYIAELVANAGVVFRFRSSAAAANEGTLDLTNAATGVIAFNASIAQHSGVNAGIYRLHLKRDLADDVWTSEGTILIGDPGAKETYLLFDEPGADSAGAMTYAGQAAASAATAVGAAAAANVSATSASASATASAGSAAVAETIAALMGDASNGLRFPATNTLNLVTAGLERLRVTPAGNLLLGTTVDAVSTISPGQIIAGGLGVYPYPVYGTGGVIGQNAVVANASYSGIASIPSFSGDGLTLSGTVNGIISAPSISHSGAGSNFVTAIGAQFLPVVVSSQSSARLSITGCYSWAQRGSLNDTSSYTLNVLFGGQFIARHLNTLPTTAVTGSVFGLTASALNLSGIVGDLAGLSLNVGIASLSSAKASSVTAAYGFRLSGFTVGAASGGPGTLTSGYGMFLTGPQIAGTGSIGTYYAIYAGSPTGAGALTNRYGIWIDDALATNYFAGQTVIGAGALAVNASKGFLYIPGCAGTPTGTPESYAGRVPLVADTTNNKLYMHSGGAWVALN